MRPYCLCTDTVEYHEFLDITCILAHNYGDHAGKEGYNNGTHCTSMTNHAWFHLYVNFI